MLKRIPKIIVNMKKKKLNCMNNMMNMMKREKEGRLKKGDAN